MRIISIVCVICVLAVTLATSSPLRADEPVTDQRLVAQGMRAYVDPATGALVPQPPAAAQRALVPEAALSTSSAGLVEEVAPGGGIMVHLQGRFRSNVTAAVQPDGSVTTGCRAGNASTAIAR